MKTIKSLKDITTLEVNDKVVFGNLEHFVGRGVGYFLSYRGGNNDKIFHVLKINKRDFIKNLGIDANCNVNFPETKSLEALTAIVSALFREYEKQQDLPKTWEEFCERNPMQNEEYYIESNSYIHAVCNDMERHYQLDRNVCTSKQEAEAFLALMQLRQLRKCYIGDWEPKWKDATTTKYCISLKDDYPEIQSWQRQTQSLSFPSYELAHKFLTNFKDLLEIAKPLL